jgi:hypothetical protein
MPQKPIFEHDCHPSLIFWVRYWYEPIICSSFLKVSCLKNDIEDKNVIKKHSSDDMMHFTVFDKEKKCFVVLEH